MDVSYCPGCGSKKIRQEDFQGRQPCDNCFAVWLIDDIQGDYQPKQLRAIFVSGSILENIVDGIDSFSADPKGGAL